MEPLNPQSASRESQFPDTPLPRNQVPIGPYFGEFLQLLRQSLVNGGSELGLGLSLFSLAASIRAATIIEIGRFKGFSTLALASALKFVDIGWDEPPSHKQRPLFPYIAFESRRPRRLLSVDPFPTSQAAELIKTAGLENYVQFLDMRSDQLNLTGEVDLIFIDGDHSYEGCRADVDRLVLNHLRPGGYFILHDYYGWYGTDSRNGSPIKKVTDELVATRSLQHLLIDTGYTSLVIFRKPHPAHDAS